VTLSRKTTIFPKEEISIEANEERILTKKKVHYYKCDKFGHYFMSADNTRIKRRKVRRMMKHTLQDDECSDKIKCFLW